MVLAQKYPEAYDDIVASAPAVNWPQILPTAAYPALLMKWLGEARYAIAQVRLFTTYPPPSLLFHHSSVLGARKGAISVEKFVSRILLPDRRDILFGLQLQLSNAIVGNEGNMVSGTGKTLRYSIFIHIILNIWDHPALNKQTR